MSDIYVHILNPIEAMSFCEYCKKYQNFTVSPSVEIFCKGTFSAGPWVIHLKICGSCLSEKFYTRKSEGIGSYVAIIYLCLFFSADLHLLIKSFLQNSFKIFLSSWIQKTPYFEISTITWPCSFQNELCCKPWIYTLSIVGNKIFSCS